jgi:precorrin-4 methylase
VLLMAVAHLDAVAAELVKRGRDAATPVAVICDGTMPSQQVLTSTLGAVADDAAAAGVQPPAVVVIGEVVRLHELLRPPVVDTTTAEPTTAEPTTAEPTTAEPTTAEPTTAEPTTAGAAAAGAAA